MRLKGDFKQSKPYGDSGARSFVSTGTKVIFEGTGVQNVNFDSPGVSNSRFDEVDVTNTNSVNFNNTTYVNGALDLVGKLHGQTGTDTITGNLTLRNGSTLTNSSSTFTVGSCTKEGGHTIVGTDPCP